MSDDQGLAATKVVCTESGSLYDVAFVLRLSPPADRNPKHVMQSASEA